MKYKSKFNGRDRSVFDPSMTLTEVVSSKVNHIVDTIVEEAPHWTLFTKRKIAWNGKDIIADRDLYNGLPQGHPIRVPLIAPYGMEKHLPYRRPSNSELEKMHKNHGVVIPDPPPGVFGVIQKVTRDIMYDLMDTTIKIAPFNKYYDESGERTDPVSNYTEPYHHKFIVGYLVWDESKVNVVNEDLSKAPAYVKYIVRDAIIDAPEMYKNIAKQMELGSAKAADIAGALGESLLKLSIGDN